MRILEFGKYQRARVWTGALPNADYPSQKTLTHTLPTSGEPRKELRLAAVELHVVTGPRSMYGLLGGQFKPDATGHLNIEISVSSSNERLFADTLALSGDEVRVGLPAEYAQAVLAGVDLAKDQLSTLAAGTLSINCAAHGAVGSCAVIYKHLAAVLVKLVNGSSLEPSDDELLKLFPTTFS